jgi:hypothetical protein
MIPPAIKAVYTLNVTTLRCESPFLITLDSTTHAFKIKCHESFIDATPTDK